MNEETGKSPKLKKWLRWMEVIRNEISELLRDESMFWEIQDIIRENPWIHKPNVFYDYLQRTYLSHTLAGLRRQIRPHKDSISLVGLLEEIAKTPAELSFRYFCSNVSESTARQGMYMTKEDFKKYADPNGEHVCPKMIEYDLRSFKSAIGVAEEYIDKRIAHWDKSEPELVPTSIETSQCFCVLESTYIKYHSLFYAERLNSLTPIYQHNWKEIFLEPWIKTGFGSAQGLIHMAEDFDDELPEFREYMQ